MSNQKGIAAYIRVSTLEQNTDLQELEIKTYAEMRGYKDVSYYRDYLGGTSDRRPEFQKLMGDIRRGRVSKLIVWKLDRFSRSLRSLVMALQEMNDLDVAFVSLRDSIDLSTANGRLMTYLLGAFAEFEAALIKERVHAGLAAAKRRGVRLGRPETPVDPLAIIKLRGNGQTIRQIAVTLNVSKSVVQRVVSQKPP